MTAARAAAVALAAALATAVPAHDAPATLPGDVEVRDGRVVASVDLATAFPPDLERQLGNGLTNVIAVHVSLVPASDSEPAAVYGREVDVLYDVWEETYGVTVKDAAHPRGERRVFASWAALRAFLSEVRGIPLAPAAALVGERWVLVTRVEVNPVSRELLDRTRELISNPAAGSRVGGGGSRSVLGAMASYLLRSADSGEDAHFFRSRPFTVREGGVVR